MLYNNEMDFEEKNAAPYNQNDGNLVEFGENDQNPTRGGVFSDNLALTVREEPEGNEDHGEREPRSGSAWVCAPVGVALSKPPRGKGKVGWLRGWAGARGPRSLGRNRQGCARKAKIRPALADGT